MRRWVHASVVAAVSLVGVTAIAPAAQAALKGGFTVREVADRPGEVELIYVPPRGLPSAELSTKEAIEARKTALAKAMGLYHAMGIAAENELRGEGTAAQSQAARMELIRYMEIIDAAEITYAKTIAKIRSPQSVAEVMQQVIGSKASSVEDAQKLTYRVHIGSMMPFLPAEAAYIQAVSQ